MRSLATTPPHASLLSTVQHVLHSLSKSACATILDEPHIPARASRGTCSHASACPLHAHSARLVETYSTLFRFAYMPIVFLSRLALATQRAHFFLICPNHLHGGVPRTYFVQACNNEQASTVLTTLPNRPRVVPSSSRTRITSANCYSHAYFHDVKTVQLCASGFTLAQSWGLLGG